MPIEHPVRLRTWAPVLVCLCVAYQRSLLDFPLVWQSRSDRRQGDRHYEPLTQAAHCFSTMEQVDSSCVWEYYNLIAGTGYNFFYPEETSNLFNSDLSLGVLQFDHSNRIQFFYPGGDQQLLQLGECYYHL